MSSHEHPIIPHPFLFYCMKYSKSKLSHLPLPSTLSPPDVSHNTSLYSEYTEQTFSPIPWQRPNSSEQPVNKHSDCGIYRLSAGDFSIDDVGGGACCTASSKVKRIAIHESMKHSSVNKGWG
jgi:hypothetical protein